jgi:hypothetical protein
LLILSTWDVWYWFLQQGGWGPLRPPIPFTTNILIILLCFSMANYFTFLSLSFCICKIEIIVRSTSSSNCEDQIKYMVEKDFLQCLPLGKSSIGKRCFYCLRETIGECFLEMLISLSLTQEIKAEYFCYSLDLECPRKTHKVKGWSPEWCYWEVLQTCKTLYEVLRPVEPVPKRYCGNPVPPLPLFYFLATS